MLLLEAGRLRARVDREVGRDRPLPLLEPRGRADGRALARPARDAAARASSATPSTTRTGWLFLVDEADAQPRWRTPRCRTRRVSTRFDVEDLAGAASRASTVTASPTRSTSPTPASPTRRDDAAYIEAFRRYGGEALEGTRVEAIEVEDGKVRGVRVGGELHPCETVVLAAGPWSVALARTAGVELPLEITREQDVVFATAPEPTIPCAVSSQVDRIYMRPAPEYGEGHLLAGRGFPKDYEHVDPDAYDDAGRRGVRGGRPRARRARGCRGSPGMRRVGGRVGLYDVTPDWHPILGPDAGGRGPRARAAAAAATASSSGPRSATSSPPRCSSGTVHVRRRRDLLGRALRRGRASCARPTGATADDRPRDPQRHGPRRHGRRAASQADVALEGDRIAAVGAGAAGRRARGRRDRASSSRPASSTCTATPTTRCSSTRARASAIHQGVTLEVVGNCGFGCFPIRDPELARKAIYGYSPDVPLDWRTAGEYFERLEAARPAVNVLSLVPNGQLRLSTVGLADRPARRRRGGGDGRPAARVARRRRLGLLDRARVRAGGGRDRGGGDRRSATRWRRRAASTRRTRAAATRAPPTRSRRRSAPRARPASGSRSRTSCRATGSRRRGARWRSSRRRATAGSTSSSTCTRASTGSRTSTRRCRRGRSRSDPDDARASCCATRPRATGCARTASLLSAGNDWSRIVLLDNPFWPAVRAPRHRRDRRRARPGAARRGLRPARRRARGAARG